MIFLSQSLRAWGSSEFRAVLKAEVESLSVSQLPLTAALSIGSYVVDEPRAAMILSVMDDSQIIRAKVGIFFNSVIAGCSCADDPTPVESVNEYTEFWFAIDKSTGFASVSM